MNEFNPNRESQQEYFGYGRMVTMNDDNRFGNNNNDNARLVQQLAQARALQELGQQGLMQQDRCYICRQKEEDLKKRLTEAADTTSKLLELKRESEIEILQLKLEVAQLRLALAKAEK